GGGVVDRGGESGKVPGSFGVGGHGEDGGVAERLAGFLPTREEVGLVFDDGAAERAAELVQVQRWSGGGEEIAGVERTIARELEEAAVELVGAGARGERDNASGGMSILGRVVV